MMPRGDKDNTEVSMLSYSISNTYRPSVVSHLPAAKDICVEAGLVRRLHVCACVGCLSTWLERRQMKLKTDTWGQEVRSVIMGHCERLLAQQHSSLSVTRWNNNTVETCSLWLDFTTSVTTVFVFALWRIKSEIILIFDSVHKIWHSWVERNQFSWMLHQWW